MEPIDSLSEEQELLWQEYLSAWQIGTYSAAAAEERDVVNVAIRGLYNELDQEPPAIMWCDSFIQMLLAPPIVQQLLRDRLSPRSLRWLRANLRDPLWQRLIENIERQLPVLRTIDRSPRLRQFDPIWSRTGAMLYSELSGWYASFRESVPSRYDYISTALWDQMRDASLAAENRNSFIRTIRNPLHREARAESMRLGDQLKRAVASELRTQVCEPIGSGDRSQAQMPIRFARNLARVHAQLGTDRCREWEHWLSSRFDEQMHQVCLHYCAQNALTLVLDKFLADAVIPGASKHSGLQHLFAIDAQAFAYIPFTNVVLVCPKPIIQSVDEALRLHNEHGPAMRWKDDFSIYSWHGMIVPPKLIERPNEITVEEIEQEPNIELRRVMIERYGQTRFLLDSGAKKLQEDKFGVLYSKELPYDEPLVIVKVLNSTPEPDGSRKEYFLRVPPTVRTAREAVAWTFDLQREFYKPNEET